VGDGSYGFVHFYRNTNSDAAPVLAPGQQLNAGTSPLTVSYRATPCFCDWDGDGRKDLLCGNGDGYVTFFRNTATEGAPLLAAGVRLQAGGVDLNLGIRSVVRLFDWDGDGVNDLVASSNDGVYWCRNIGSPTAPALQARVALCAPVSGGGLTAINTGGRMRLDLVDWNNDGVIDLIVGNLNGTVSFYEGYRFVIREVGAQPAGEFVLRWTSAPFLGYRLLAGPAVSLITNVLATHLPSAGTTTSWTNTAPVAPEFYRVQIE
jgi:hypothetical protein